MKPGTISACASSSITSASPRTRPPAAATAAWPATWSSTAILAKSRIDIRSEQGYEIGRPSLLLLKAEDAAGHIHISVGGKSIIVARGEFI